MTALTLELAPPARSTPARDPKARCACHEATRPSCAGKDEVFVGLLKAYRGRGGVARERDLLLRLQPRIDEPRATLASWLRDGRLFGYEWNGELWLPMFQLDRRLMPCPSAQAVGLELRGDLKGWEMALWFVTPNSWLAGRAPADALVGAPEAVRQAARADRFLANG